MTTFTREIGSLSRDELIVAQALSRTFPGPPPVRALTSASLIVRRGEFVAIQGPSGSGKSTLTNLLGLLDRPTSGSYQLNGAETATMKESRRTSTRAREIGYVFQAFHLIDDRTVQQNVEMAGLYGGAPLAERRAFSERMIDRVGLGALRGARPRTMSGGERQRVAIARALAHHPAILIADEPTGNLDQEASRSIMELLAELHGEGQTILVVTHDDAVSACAERVISVNSGRTSP